MAVPKKRTGHSAQGKRRANWKAEKPTLSKCSNCGATTLAHTVCTECGYYKGKPVSLKDQADVKVEKKAEVAKEEVKTEDKPVKKASTKKSTTAKSTKKVEKVEEIKEEKAEEVKGAPEEK